MPGRHLPVSPSLNRAVIAAWPGLPVGVAGTPANAWLTTWSIARWMARRVEAGEAIRASGRSLPPLNPPEDGVTAELMAAAVAWPLALDSLVADGSPVAERLADDLGRVLGGLVATLVLGPIEARTGRTDWTSAEWDRWAAVRHIAVGGGIVAGALGERMARACVVWLHDLGVPVTVRRVERGAVLALTGAASLLPELAGSGSGRAHPAVALDCGGTAIKRAVLEDGDLSLLESVPAPGRGSATDVVEVIADAVTDALAEANRHTGQRYRGTSAEGRSGAVAVSLSLATYVDESGQPFSGQLGPYAPLGDLDLATALTSALRSRTGRQARLRVTHDGAAALLAARLERPDTDAAIVLGTAIGSGVVPVPARPQPLPPPPLRPQPLRPGRWSS